MSAFTEDELIAEAKDNLVRLIEKQMVDHIRNRWEKYVDSMDNSDDPRNMILDVVCNANWAESKIRITNKMEHLRLLVLFTVDLDIDDDCNPKEVLVEGRVSPSMSPAQAEFRPCGQSLFGSVAVDMTVKP
jgi:hypothetical protein